MNFYLNNLSMDKEFTGVDHESIIKEFLDVFSHLSQYKFERIVVHINFLDDMIIDGLSIRKLWSVTEDNNLKSRLKSLRANTITINYKEQVNSEVKILHDVTYNGRTSELLAEAYQISSPVVSFNSHEQFHVNHLDVKYHSMKKDKYWEKEDTLVNFCLPNRCIEHEEYLRRKRIEFLERDIKWDAGNAPFRLKAESKKYLDDAGFSQDNAGLDDGQRVEKYNSIGTTIAGINGWIEDKRISATNHRKVFKSYGRKTMYISIDTRHGEFELFDKNGEHQKAYSFYGEPVEKDDDKNTHKLNINEA